MKHVLLVEDDHLIAKSLRLRLHHMGWTITHARDASAAMNALDQDHPDVVLLDINLPGDNGFMIADRIRRSEEHQRLPIVFITASHNPEYRRQASERSRCDLLEKPFTASQLENALPH